MKKRWRRWQLRILSVAMGCGLACLVAEVSLRMLGIGYPQLYHPDPYCGSRLRPSVRGVWTTEGFGRVATNALGFRGPEIQTIPPLETQRIAVLGDSFIEALQLDDELGFCQQLARQLRTNLPLDASPVEVINCGVSGYGTAQQLLMLRHYVLPLQPDVVLLAIYPGNDVRNNHPRLEQDPRMPYYSIDAQGQLVLDDSFRESIPYHLASGSYERWKAAWVNRSRVLQVLRHARLQQASASSAAMSAPSSLSLQEQLCTEAQDASYIYGPPVTNTEAEAWRVTERLISEIAEACQQQQIRLVVFTVSTPLQVYPDAQVRQRVSQGCGVKDLFYAERRLELFCRERAIEFFPLASQLQTQADDSGEYLHGFDNTQLGMGHWNAAGHAAAAHHVAQFLGQAIAQPEADESSQSSNGKKLTYPPSAPR